MNKIISCILTFLLSIPIVFAGNEKNLNTVFDEFQYAITVEWDQKDEAFRDYAMTNFQSQIRELQAQGLTSTELMSFASSRIKNPAQLLRLENAFIATKNKQISQDELIQIIQKDLKDAQMKGASWTAETEVIITISILVVALALAVVFDVPVITGASISF